MSERMLTEHEAWCEIEQYLVNVGPSALISYGGDVRAGLCALLENLYYYEGAGLISAETKAAMKHRLYKARDGRMWLATPGRVRPRLPWVRKFIRATSR